MDTKYIVVAGIIGLGILLIVLLSFGSGGLPAFEDKFNVNSNTTLGQAPSTAPQITELQGQEIAVGTGSAEVAEGDTITVHYIGSFLDGQKFDSSYDRNEPFTITVGADQVIVGFDQGVRGMKVGGKRKILIPPSLAYGEKGAGPIPANTPIVFEVELLEIKPAQSPTTTPEISPEPSPTP